MKMGDVMRNVRSDVRLGARSLLKNPGFLVVVVDMAHKVPLDVRNQDVHAARDEM